MVEDSEWVQELRSHLEIINADYSRMRQVGETGIDEDGLVQNDVVARATATAAATQALVRVTLALVQFPELRNPIKDGPLPDLIAALDDLRRGQSPEFFRPWPQKKGNISTQLNILKIRAVTSVLVLERSGATNAEARKIVAKIFADAGHKGKKGFPVSASTLFQWCVDIQSRVPATTEHRIVSGTMTKLPDVITRAEAVRLTKLEALKRL